MDFHQLMLGGVPFRATFHRDVPVDREDRYDLEACVARDVGVGAVAAENHAVAKAVAQRAPHLERPRHVREKAAIAEDRDRLFRIAPVMSHHCVLRSRGWPRKGTGLQPSFQSPTGVISLSESYQRRKRGADLRTTMLRVSNVDRLRATGFPQYARATDGACVSSVCGLAGRGPLRATWRANRL